MFGTSHDITEERLAEAARHATEIRFRTFVDHATDALFLHDARGRLVDVNRHACETLGYTREEMIGMMPGDFDPSITPEQVSLLGARLAAEGTVSFETMQRRKDGTQVPVEIRMRRFWDGEHRIVALARDITERKLAEEKLRASEVRFRRLIENASDLISVIDHAGVIQFQSPAVERILGYTPEEMVGHPCFEYLHPADVEKKRAMLASAVAAPGTQVVIEQRVRRRDGAWRTLQTIGQSIPDLGEGGSIVLNSRDLTDARELEEHLRQAQKMEAIGQLAGGVAHDFNNILAAIMMQTDLSGIPGVPEDVRENVGQIQSAAERAAELTRQLLMFSRRQLLQPRDVDINEQVINLAKMLQRIIGEHITLRLALHPTPLVTRADPGMIDQLLMNLAINSRDAMPAGGSLAIETAEQFSDASFVRAHPQLTAPRCIAIRVRDTGLGIPPDVLPRVFEPFFTTKEAGKGTGLGLATVFGIVQQHHGAIDVHSELERGTTFEVFLPFEGTGQVVPVAAKRATPRGSDEVVMVVEDDPALRRTTRRTLTRYGYRVVEAASGREALDLWDTLPAPPALLLTDLVMPGMSGHQVAAALRERSPELKVLYTSGYSAEIAGKALELRAGENFVQKPLSPAALLEVVRRALDT
jgi:PAS domain S-box-containing protein